MEINQLQEDMKIMKARADILSAQLIAHAREIRDFQNTLRFIATDKEMDMTRAVKLCLTTLEKHGCKLTK
jgi:hypothetical protein